ASVRRFGDVAMSPAFRHQTPADLDAAGCSGRYGIRRLKPREADAFACVPALERPEAVTPLRNSRRDMIEQFVGLLPRAAHLEKLHHRLIGIDSMKQLSICVFPVAQYEAISGGWLQAIISSCR